jgi:ubiquitin-protein ligase
MEKEKEFKMFNEVIIKTIESKTVSRRLSNELKKLYSNNYEEVLLELNDTSNTIILSVRENIKGQKSEYKFEFGYSYPFTCPKIFFNGYKYSDFLRSKTLYENNNLKKATGIECFCCSSVTCSSNWNPCIFISKIINEINYFRNIRRNFAYKIIANHIKKKYLIQDINLECWF